MRTMLLIILIFPLFMLPAYAEDIYSQAARETGIFAVEDQLPDEAKEISGALKVDGSYDTENALERLWNSFLQGVQR